MAPEMTTTKTTRTRTAGSITKFAAGTNRGTKVCGDCGKRTWESRIEPSSGLCVECYNRAGDENSVADGYLSCATFVERYGQHSEYCDCEPMHEHTICTCGTDCNEVGTGNHYLVTVDCGSSLCATPEPRTHWPVAETRLESFVGNITAKVVAATYSTYTCDRCGQVRKDASKSAVARHQSTATCRAASAAAAPAR
jgi:hypothetical protein